MAISKRGFLAALSAIPFLGVFAQKANAGLRIKGSGVNSGDVVALKSTEHPYAVAGETVTCESGHPICDFVETVNYGQMQDVKRQLGNWRQPEAKIGEFPIRGCAVCGKPWTTGSTYHFKFGWRGYGHGSA